MEKQNTATPVVRKLARALQWRIETRRIPAPANAMPLGCNDCGCGAPARRPQTAGQRQG